MVCRDCDDRNRSLAQGVLVRQSDQGERSDFETAGMSEVPGETSPPTDQKTAYGIPIRNLWHMLLYAWNEPPDSPYRKIVGDEPGPSLDALLAISLARL